jgi:hypothetical protein
MKLPSASPILRLSIGLVSLVISLTLAAEFFGFIPDQAKLALDAGTNICETLADWKQSQYGFLAFITLTGFVFFWLFLRRALKELDPSRVVPELIVGGQILHAVGPQTEIGIVIRQQMKIVFHGLIGADVLAGSQQT